MTIDSAADYVRIGVMIGAKVTPDRIAEFEEFFLNLGMLVRFVESVEVRTPVNEEGGEVEYDTFFKVHRCSERFMWIVSQVVAEPLYWVSSICEEYSHRWPVDTVKRITEKDM